MSGEFSVDEQDLLGRTLDDAQRTLAERGVRDAAVTWTSAFAGQRPPRGNRERGDARVVRVRDGGRSLTAAMFPTARTEDYADFSEKGR